MAAAGLGTLASAGTAAAAADPVADGSMSAEDFALAKAKETGQPYELVSARTESSDTWATPAGKWSVKRYGTPVRVLRGGVWVATDPTLVFAADGRVVSKAATVSVAFSGGGSGPLLTGAKDGRTLSLSWPKALPKPTLAANVATYANVLPDVDLQVKAEVEGFSQLLVVKTAAAAANPELASLKFKVDTVGLNVSADAGTGAISAVNPAGQTVFTSPSPLMWDSTTAAPAGAQPVAGVSKTSMSASMSMSAAAGAGVASAPSDAFIPPAGAKDAQMPTTVANGSLEIKPDQALLTGAQTKYPVFIDPSWAWGERQNWTRVYKKYPNTSYWNTKDDVRVGYEAETNGLSRSFFQLDTSNIKGALVSKSTLRVRNTWSWSCQARPVELWHVGAISSKTSWSNQPERISKVASVNQSKGWSSDCAAGNLEFDATDLARKAAAGGWSGVTVGLYAANESDTYGWKRFDPKTLTLETEYNNPPKTPSSLGTSPRTACSGGSIGNTGISLYATVEDPDAGNLSAEFELFKAGQSTPTASQAVPALQGRFATWVVPDASLPSGSYTWKVRAKDQEGASSPWTAGCTFTVDRDRPSKKPGITSAEFPSGESGWPANTGKARTPGTFTFDANGVADVAEYIYWSDTDAEQQSTPPGKAVKITPMSYGPHVLNVQSVDAAGNRSDTTVYKYYANRGGALRDAPGDLNGDGFKDIWSTDSNGILSMYAGVGNGSFVAGVNGGATATFQGQQALSGGDWTWDGYNDLVTFGYDSVANRKLLWAYANKGGGIIDEHSRTELTVSCPVKNPDLGCDFGDDWNGDDHWYNAEQVLAPGDLNGDNDPDILVKQGKQLWVYYSSGNMLDAREPVLVGEGDWDKYTVITPGDTNGDAIPDLWLRDNATGDMFRAYGAKGTDGNVDPTTWGNKAGRVYIGYGVKQSDYPSIGSAGDANGDGTADLWARKADNTMIAWLGKNVQPGQVAFDAGVVVDGSIAFQPGTRLASGQTYTTPSVKLVMQSDGNLVLYHRTGGDGKGGALWASETYGNPGAYAVMQADGNLVVYKQDGGEGKGGALWASQTYGNPGARLQLQADGNLVIYKSGTSSGWQNGLWATDTWMRSPRLQSGQELTPGAWIQGKRNALLMDRNGHLSLRDLATGKEQWLTDFWSPGAHARMQADGNFVLYSKDGGEGKGGALWASQTYGNAGAYLQLQDDGNLVVYRKDGDGTWQTALWATNTWR
ncbi:DNRLRE domain-containing protein [Streptomyces sp. NPDC051109]|uniref:DNRLRE domain-containing protein n=1 Tax=Streptomyces sp. NPDC051109 TaxID=3365642 RepID=UPI0037A61204